MISDKLSSLWYGLSARWTTRKSRKRSLPNPFAAQDMRHVSGIVDSARAFPFINVRGSGAHPVYIKVSYTVDCTVYYKREVFLTNGDCPVEGARMTVVYPKNAPNRATLVF